VLLTGGTLARLAAEGHRTVVVVACCGGLGADPETRLAELRVSAARLGLARVVHLAAHRTQVYGRGRAGRLFRLLVRLPVPVFGLVAGREWFTEPGAESARPIGDGLQPAARAEGTVRR